MAMDFSRSFERTKYCFQKSWQKYSSNKVEQRKDDSPKISSFSVATKKHSREICFSFHYLNLFQQIPIAIIVSVFNKSSILHNAEMMNYLSYLIELSIQKSLDRRLTSSTFISMNNDKFSLYDPIILLILSIYRLNWLCKGIQLFKYRIMSRIGFCLL